MAVSDAVKIGDSLGGETFSAPTNQKLLDEVHAEIRQHEKQKQSQSYLSKVFDGIYRGDDRSLDRLKTIAIELGVNPQEIAAKDNQQKVREAIQKDRKQLEWQESVSKWGGVVAKTAPLLMDGKSAFVGAAITSALGEAKPSDDLGTQVADLALGAGKGLLLKAAFAESAKIPVESVGGLALRATAFGVTSRAIDTGLSRMNYIDPTNDQFSLSTGLGNLAKQTFHPYAIATDLASLGLAATVLGAANHASGGFLMRDVLSSRIASGASFGFASGSLGEAQSQLMAGQDIEFGKIFLNGGKQALASGIAAIPGGIQGRIVEKPRYTYEYPKTDTTATVVVSLDGGKKTVVIQRGLAVEAEPGKTAFPGGFMNAGKENVYAAAARELREETGLIVNPRDLKLVDVRSNPARDHRGHIVDVGFRWDVPKTMTDAVLKKLRAGDDASGVKVIPTADLQKQNMAFDHNQLRDASFFDKPANTSM
ncbi:MAG: NUDIX domain-containing protein [Candidatus Obscuribacterales bacterium]|nr:NUDIX domain-containing protein [Candidatus Obscuribacterales bacterium]